ncbi:MAG: C39 family peptidase [Lachnospiraceae bacterium]|nr:C39 family peptidase [Lachnospiraceae bacterium]
MSSNYRNQENENRQYTSGGKRRKKKKKAKRRFLVQCVFLLGTFLNLILTFYLLGRIRALSPESKAADAGGSSIAQSVVADKEEPMDADELAWVRANAEFFPEGKVEHSVDNPGLIHFLYQYGKGDYETGGDISFSKAERTAELPLLMQWDARWGFEEYGSSVIGITGCGPTCVSMVVLGITGDFSANPKTLADWATVNGYYMQGTGTKWSFILDGAAAFGVRGKELGSGMKQILSELEAGNPVILNVGAGHFTDAGHFIVAVGVAGDQIIINDPNSMENSRHGWTAEEIQGEIRDAWVFYP